MCPAKCEDRACLAKGVTLSASSLPPGPPNDAAGSTCGAASQHPKDSKILGECCE